MVKSPRTSLWELLKNELTFSLTHLKWLKSMNFKVSTLVESLLLISKFHVILPLQHYRYAGLQSGSNCSCSNDYGRYGNSSACNISCPGNDSINCGGHLANLVLRESIFEKIFDIIHKISMIHENNEWVINKNDKRIHERVRSVWLCGQKLASKPKGPDSSPGITTFWLKLQTSYILRFWCPCSQNSVNEYQLVSGEVVRHCVHKCHAVSLWRATRGRKAVCNHEIRSKACGGGLVCGFVGAVAYSGAMGHAPSSATNN